MFNESVSAPRIWVIHVSLPWEAWPVRRFESVVCFNMVVYFLKEYHNETKIQNPKAYGGMVKWLSQQTFNLPVPGSNPSAPTI